MLRRCCAVVVVAIVVLLGQSAAAAGQARAAGRVQLRVDQAGYIPSEAKQAILMTSMPARGARFDVLRDHHIVKSGHLKSSDRGAWNATYAHTYTVTFSGIRQVGTYRLVVHTRPAAIATVKIRSLASIYRAVLGDGVKFDQVQRDGAHVINGSLHRRPSHLNDTKAGVYATPTFDPDTDEITGNTLTKIGGPVDVSGGWYDAGDYLKFTHTAAFADVVLLSAQRQLSSKAPAALRNEARYGIDWLSKMWRPATKTLYLQVGIGNGTSDGKLYGDHDLWRLPQADDHDKAASDKFAAAHRPVFEAAPPGKPISPNLAGRVAAAFALAAQNDAAHSPSRARSEYGKAVAILKLADTASPPNPLTTALPNDFYPESTWQDDMELGATEVALAAQRLHKSSAHWLSQATTWAHDYLTDERGDTFNLYDTSALAHADLVRAINATPHRNGLAVSRKALLADLARQLRGAAQHASADQFHAAGDIDNFDVDSHTFGLIATAGWYHQLTGSSTFDRVATEQRDWLFGTNAWGVSFMVGVGTSYPHCMQHQVANLSGTTTGKAPIAIGAVVNGPNNADNFSDGLGGFQDGMKHCAITRYKAFDGHGSRYVDDVRSWQTDEPAIDMTGAAIAAAAAQLAH